MLDRIEYLAYLSVARGCGFAALGIVTFFLGMAGDLTLACKSAGYLSLLTAIILLLKARFADRNPYRRTEVWIMLKPAERPEPTIAQAIISRVLREAYLTFAWRAAFLAMLFLAVGFVSGLLRP